MSSFSALYGRTSGVATIQGPYLVFTSDVDGSQVSLALSNLEVTIEGLNSHHYYFFDKYRPQERICIQDNGLLKLLSEKGVPSAGGILKESKKRKLRRNLLITSPFAITLAFLIAIPLVLSLLPASWIGALLTEKQEKALGEWMFPLIRTQFRIEENHPARPHLQALLDHLKASNPELKDLDIDIYASTSSEINAFAAPGNIIVMNKGLIEKAETTEEVMGVLAHEVGHIEQKHVLKSLAGGLGSLLGTVILATFVGYDGALVIASATDFLQLKYSRDDETEADKRGFEFLRNANISTSGMINFFKKMAESEGTISSRLSFASTHPAAEDRVKILTNLAERNPDSSLIEPPVDIKELQASF